MRFISSSLPVTKLASIIKFVRLAKSILILTFLCWGYSAWAQMPGESSTMPEQWQLTLDVIKSRAQSLMVENNGLNLENQKLAGRMQELQQAIDEQKNKNEQMSQSLKERHNRTDQQLRIEELTQIIKTKKLQVRAYEEQLLNLNRQQSILDRKIRLLKVASSAGKTPSATDGQLAQLRNQLEDENKKEVLLENELEVLKGGGKIQNSNTNTIDFQNQELEAHLDVLRLKKLRHEEKISDDQISRANGRRYEDLKRRKDELEININAYEKRLDELRESSLMVLSWNFKKKKLIHEMVQTDARNNQMRDKIKVLHEDIDVLKDQVNQLERRVKSVGAGSKPVRPGQI